MSASSYAPLVQSSSPTTTTPAPVCETQELGSNEANVSELGLGSSLLGSVGDWIGDVWDWVTGADEEQAQQGKALQPVCRTSDGETPPDIAEVADVSATDVRAIYANNPRAQRALDALTADPGFAALSPTQQGGLLQRFQEAPNAATTQYLTGLAAYHSSEDKLEGIAAYEDALKPDGGTFVVGGSSYTIQDGQLLDGEGVVAGSIRTDGSYQMVGEDQPRNYYEDHNTRVQLTEGEGEDAATLLDLHDADPNGVLTNANMNDSFSGRATETLRDLRREGVDMRAQSGYRSFAEQDRLYNQGRTTGGGVVTNARGGESWHNYGVAADIVFNDENGQPSWSSAGDNAQLWSRYGELAVDNGLEWGGNWTGFTDRPHVELHPGLTSGDASTLKDEVRRGGLEEAWDAMGIGEQP